MTDTVVFSFFDTVRLVTDTREDPCVGQVVGILFKPGATLYQVQWNVSQLEYHYAGELVRAGLEKTFD